MLSTSTKHFSSLLSAPQLSHEKLPLLRRPLHGPGTENSNPVFPDCALNFKMRKGDSGKRRSIVQSLGESLRSLLEKAVRILTAWEVLQIRNSGNLAVLGFPRFLNTSHNTLTSCRSASKYPARPGGCCRKRAFSSQTRATSFPPLCHQSDGIFHSITPGPFEGT